MKPGKMTALLAMTSSVASACSAEDRSGEAVEAINGGTAMAHNDTDSSPAARAAVAGRIVISSERGRMIADLAESRTARALLAMLPLTVEMRDHLRQEKTGSLPSPLPEGPRQTTFSAGTIGLWGTGDFVIYYRDGRVPLPGIVVLGRVDGNTSMFDTPGPVTVHIGKGG